MDLKQKLLLLTSKREHIFRDIQILYDLSKQITTDQSKIGLFKSRYKRIEAVRNEFVQVMDDINTLQVEDPKYTIEYKPIQAFDDLYYAVIAAAERNLSPPQLDDDPQSQYVKPCAQIRLPQLVLPNFCGNIELWQTFYDTFLSIVHQNENISDIEKFHYLLSCLSGPALSIAKGLPVTSRNYNIVFNALIDRFDNKRILAANYLEKICNLPPLRAGNFSELRNLTSSLQESVNALRAMKIDNLGEFILFHLAARSLDADTRRRFEASHSSEIPTFDTLLKFLQDYVKIIEVSDPRFAFQGLNLSPKFAPRLTSNKVRPRSSSAYPVNTETYDEPGPYSEIDPYSEPEPGAYSDRRPSSDPGTGPYSGRPEFRAGMYSGTVPKQKIRFPDCVCCGFSHHGIYKCPLFHSYNISDRKNVIRTKNLCINCLRPNHSADKCTSNSNCSKCNARHHTLVHDEGSLAAGVENSEIETTPPVDPVVSMSSTSSSAYLEQGRVLVLLGTCVVRIRSGDNVGYARALIDSGAQDCFITSACAQRLSLKRRRCHITVAGLGQNTVHQVKGLTTCTIEPRNSTTPCFEINPIVMDTITNKMPAMEIPTKVRDVYKHLILADEKFDVPGDIELLIGAELFHNIYDGQRLEFGPDLPAALHSVFGWVITGKLNVDFRPPATTTNLLASTLHLEKVLKQFWEVEEPPTVKLKHPEEDICEEIYKKRTIRKPDGRYVVPMLLKEPYRKLGDSYNTARSRLQNLEKRFQRQEMLQRDYIGFMREYLELGHMRQIEPANHGLNIIPHHCVLRPESATTKLRVVFDGSATTSNGVSLNDIVYSGPKLQNDIVDIITKFRLLNVVFTADISKMYRNIDLCESDRIYQHILWRDSPGESIQEYELNTVTYGITSSPYLAIRTLHQLAEDHGSQWPEAANVLRENTFMDDIIAGAPSLELALKLKDDLIHLLDCGKFELRKWSSNSPEFLTEIPSDHCQVPKTFWDDTNQHVLKILGIRWEPEHDTFTYSVTKLDSRYTKRSILSNIARIYDPLGWLAPMVLVAKLLIQDLWRRQLTWDEPIPDDVTGQWKIFLAELPHLSSIYIPRQVIPPKASKVELIGFCDGSSKAYGCCIYLRAKMDEYVIVRLLLAKTKVAPLKPLTVNRLELCAAEMLSRSLSHMHQLLSSKLPISSTLAFTDSRTVLAWLRIPPFQLKTFVAHRIVKITDKVAVNNWGHVSTHDNPADHCSRGLTCSQLAASSLWWSGPGWLTSDISTWPIQLEISSTEAIPELKPTLTTSAISEPKSEQDIIFKLLEHHSALSHVQRVLAWCLRFVTNTKLQIQSRVNSVLTSTELTNALLKLVKYEQTTDLVDTLKLVQSNKPCCREIQKLSPYIDDAGLLRVGGRLQNSQLPPSTKHPLLLAKCSRLSSLIIDHFHLRYLHCGPRTLQSLIQRNYWILGIRNLIRSRLTKCITCFKVNPTPCIPKMGDLPSSRIQPARCFQKVGIDFAGPFTLKENKRRNARTYKAYVGIFICHAVKAIHLEVVTELSTQAFIAALDRMVSRRGLCQYVVTDCGTNFVGACRYLQETQQFLVGHQPELQAELSKRQIKWCLNPPTGSHFGGIFESGVKSMKYHWKRVVGLQVLTFEETATVLAKIEAVLNSRPLCVISTDPNEVDILTPGHFLIGEPLVSVPEPNLDDTYIPPRERWQLLQKMTQCFWRSWQQDYLHTLQQRSKWIRNIPNIQIGDIVLIIEQNLPPLEWRRGKIIDTHPGKDGIIRVVSLRTAGGVLRRPVAKLCPLPLNN